MKRKNLFFSFFAFVILFTNCSEENSQSEENIVAEELQEENLETFDYTFRNQRFVVNFQVENDELVAIDSRDYQDLTQVFSENENLIQHYLSDNEILIFANEDEFNSYFDDIGKPLKGPNLTASSNIYNAANLQIYYDCCYDQSKRVIWDFATERQGCFIIKSGEDRLRDFTDVTAWTGISGPAPILCFPPNSNISNRPNDRLNSVSAVNVLARFYENINYGGSSISLDARDGNPRGFRKLRQVRNGTFGRNWRDRISSIRLYP
ncbi:hypothetical protein [Flagellimonas meridianipacifica]|uniref:Uncharacterized protein n=1 Tax=Flagellimonas meridianipacifica TaxID=1080225 RepID=A0A2T0M726_9FLAO|nr:hypothetical protein [Allomuricauda pacifica]PRX53222.1 hypothetical protein CLV81_4131 [Allomuricauda pacifica]